MDRTLKEVCEELNITRRVVQGYEKERLVCATGRNKYGYLLYDSKMVERIALVKRYRDLGFSLKEVKSLIDAPASIVCDCLKKQVKQLKQMHKDLCETINMANDWIESLEKGGQ